MKTIHFFTVRNHDGEQKWTYQKLKKIFEAYASVSYVNTIFDKRARNDPFLNGEFEVAFCGQLKNKDLDTFKTGFIYGGGKCTFKLLDKPPNNSTKNSQKIQQIMGNIKNLKLKDRDEFHKRLKNMRDFKVNCGTVKRKNEYPTKTGSDYRSEKSLSSKIDDQYDLKIVIHGDSDFKPTSPDFEDLKKCFKTISDEFASTLIHEQHEDDFNILSNTSPIKTYQNRWNSRNLSLMHSNARL